MQLSASLHKKRKIVTEEANEEGTNENLFIMSGESGPDLVLSCVSTHAADIFFTFKRLKRCRDKMY